MVKSTALSQSLATDPEFLALAGSALSLAHCAAVAVRDLLNGLERHFRARSAAVAIAGAAGTMDDTGAADSGSRSNQQQQQQQQQQPTDSPDDDHPDAVVTRRVALLSTAARSATASLARNGAALLKTVESLGGLDGLVDGGVRVLRDRKAQADVLRRAKTALIAFVLQYLPSVKVPTVTGQRNNIEYCMDGGFGWVVWVRVGWVWVGGWTDERADA